MIDNLITWVVAFRKSLLIVDFIANVENNANHFNLEWNNPSKYFIEQTLEDAPIILRQVSIMFIYKAFISLGATLNKRDTQWQPNSTFYTISISPSDESWGFKSSITFTGHYILSPRVLAKCKCCSRRKLNQGFELKSWKTSFKFHAALMPVHQLAMGFVAVFSQTILAKENRCTLKIDLVSHSLGTRTIDDWRVGWMEFNGMSNRRWLY